MSVKDWFAKEKTEHQKVKDLAAHGILEDAAIVYRLLSHRYYNALSYQGVKVRIKTLCFDKDQDDDERKKYKKLARQFELIREFLSFEITDFFSKLQKCRNISAVSRLKSKLNKRIQCIYRIAQKSDWLTEYEEFLRYDKTDHDNEYIPDEYLEEFFEDKHLKEFFEYLFSVEVI